jgi:hypothetical protein
MLGRFAQYDSYERHRAVALLLGEGYCDWMLDVGGMRGVLARYLPAAKVVALNVDKAGDVHYEGRTIPFRRDAFHSVVSLDTVEHVPAELRDSFLDECIRVARRVVLIAAPLGTPGHSAYEARLDVLYREVHGSYNCWLHEHVLHGLPTGLDLGRWQRSFGERGFSVQLRYAGDYEWQCRNMERSLWLIRRLAALGKLAGLLNLLGSLAIWRHVVLSEHPHATTNRFYLFAHRS